MYTRLYTWVYYKPEWDYLAPPFWRQRFGDVALSCFGASTYLLDYYYAHVAPNSCRQDGGAKKYLTHYKLPSGLSI